MYTTGEIIAAGRIPGKYVLLNEEPFVQCRGVTPPGGVYCHISGIDLVRDGSGQFCVLEDNLRCPSGVSYVLENRRVLKQTFPRVFGAEQIRPVDNYADKLLETLESLAPGRGGRPTVAVLTPGVYNSAYFEHSFLAHQMGVPLVQGDDLVIDDGHVKMRTTRGLQTVDVLYRRIDDAFLDPETFRKDSLLGVPGIMDVYRAGRVALANAPGAGIADNKVIYHYVPEMIDYYLNEKPILDNVETWLCAEADQRKYVLEHLAELVVKPAHEAGGKGIVVGPHASKAELDKCAADIAADPDNYIAQPTLEPLPGPHAHRRRHRRPPRRPAALRALRQGRALRAARRAHAGRAQEGLARRQFVAGRRHQGHVDCRLTSTEVRSSKLEVRSSNLQNLIPPPACVPHFVLHTSNFEL